MTAPVEIPVVHVNMPCKDAGEFQLRIAPHMSKEGVFVPFNPPLPKGARVLLRVHWIGGTIGVRGEAVVTEVASSGRAPGMTVKLVSLDPESVKFPLFEPAPKHSSPWLDDEP